MPTGTRPHGNGVVRVHVHARIDYTPQGRGGYLGPVGGPWGNGGPSPGRAGDTAVVVVVVVLANPSGDKK